MLYFFLMSSVSLWLITEKKKVWVAKKQQMGGSDYLSRSIHSLFISYCCCISSRKSTPRTSQINLLMRIFIFFIYCLKNSL